MTGGLQCCEVNQPKKETKNLGPTLEEQQASEKRAKEEKQKQEETAQRMADLYVLTAVQKGEWSKAGDVRSVLERRGGDREVCRAAAKAAENIATHECGLDALVETGALQQLAKVWQTHSTDTQLAVPVQTVTSRFWEKACSDHEWYHREGPKAAALALVCTKRQEWLGECHRLAVELHRAGHPRAAEAYMMAIDSFTQQCGPTHRCTLQAQNNLAVLKEEQFELAEAEALHDRVYKCCMAAPELGQNHPDTLSSKFNLAALKAKQGKYKDSETLYREVIKQRETALGVEHLDTIRAKSNFAGVLRKIGKLPEAEALLNEVTDLRQKLNGIDDPKVLDSRCHLALVIAEQGNTVKAEEMLKYVVDARRENPKLGKDHPDTLIALSYLGMLQLEKQSGKVPEQTTIVGPPRKTLHDEVWDLMDRKVPEERRRARPLEGSLTADMDTETAKKHIEKVLERRRQHLKPDHPDVLAARAELAMITARAGQLQCARGEREDIADAYEKNLGKLHVDTLASRVALAQCLMQEAYTLPAGEGRESLRSQAHRKHAETVTRFAESIAPIGGTGPAWAGKSDGSATKHAVLKRE